jgi:hypothetical protein
MQNLIKVAVIVAITGFAAPAAAEPPGDGDRCTLDQKVVFKVKKGEQWVKKKLPAGTEITVLKRTKRFVRVKTGRRKGRIWTKLFDASCRVPRKLQPEPIVPAAPEKPVEPAAERPEVANREKTEASETGGESAFGTTYKIKILIMDLKGSKHVPARLLQSLSSAVSEEMDTLGPFKAISGQDIVQMLNLEENKQLLGCTETSCMSEIGGAIGADFLVSGDITQSGNVYIVQLQLINTREARVDSRTSREYQGEPQGLFAELKVMAKILVRDILSKRSGKLALEVSEEGATVRVDGSIRGVSPLYSVTMAGGIHTVSVEKEGFILYRQDVKIVEDQETALNVRLLPSVEFKRQYTERARRVQTGAWISFGLGVAALVGAGTTYGLSRSNASDLNADIRAYNNSEARSTLEYERLGKLESDIGTLDAMTVTTGAVGIAGLVVAMVLWISGDDPNRFETMSSKHQENIRPLLAPGELGVLGTF